jgi:FAD/FMN-containing dehydrogenase
VWNASIDRHPALIARCAGVADVIEAVRFARTHQLLVAVRGGGHSYPGYGVCDGGMVIDPSPMKGIRVDPEARTVRAQAGVLLGELDRATQAFGFAVPAGFISHTGMAGLTLGGGIGFTMRKLGLTIDNLISVDVVTAEGEFVKASEQENADLFWGLRGGGGNFGIATDFEFRLNALGPEIYAGPIFWPIAEAPRVLRFYRDWIADCPDELTTLITERKAPATLAGLPAELVGQHVIAVTAIYAGTVDEGEKVVRPLKEFGSPALDRCARNRRSVRRGPRARMCRYVRAHVWSGASFWRVVLYCDRERRSAVGQHVRVCLGTAEAFEDSRIERFFRHGLRSGEGTDQEWNDLGIRRRHLLRQHRAPGGAVVGVFRLCDRQNVSNESHALHA